MFTGNNNAYIEENGYENLVPALFTQEYTLPQRREHPRFKETNRAEWNALGNGKKKLCLQTYCRPSHTDTSVLFTPVIRYGKSTIRSSRWGDACGLDAHWAPPSPPRRLLFDHPRDNHLRNNKDSSKARFRCSSRNSHQTTFRTLRTTESSSSSMPPPQLPFETPHGIASVYAGSQTRTFAHPSPRAPEEKPAPAGQASAVAVVAPLRRTPPAPAIARREGGRSPPWKGHRSPHADAAPEALSTSSEMDWFGLQRSIQSRTHRAMLTALNFTNLTELPAGQWRWFCRDVVPELHALRTLRLARMGLEDWHLAELLRGCHAESSSAGVLSSPSSVIPSSGVPFCRALPRLRVLDVSGNNLSHHSATHLGEMLLWASDTLEELHLASNPLRDHGVQMLGMVLSKLCVEGVRAEPYLFPAKLVRDLNAASRQESRVRRERVSFYGTEGSEPSALRGSSTTPPRFNISVSDVDGAAIHRAGDAHQRATPPHRNGAVGPRRGPPEASCALLDVHIGLSLLNARDCGASARGLSDLLRGASHAHRLRVLMVGKDLPSLVVPFQGGVEGRGASDVSPLTNFGCLRSPCAFENLDLSGFPLSQVMSPPFECMDFFSRLFLACPRLRCLDVSASFNEALVPPKVLHSAIYEGVCQQSQQGPQEVDEEDGREGGFLVQMGLVAQTHVGDILSELLAKVAFDAAMRQRPFFSAFSHLRELHLSRTGLTDAGVRGLCVALRTAPQNGDHLFFQCLSVLTASGNLLTAVGCVQLLSVFLIESHIELTFLEIQGNMGVPTSDRQGLDSINKAVQKALDHRSRGKPCGAALALSAECFVQSNTASEDREDIPPLTIRYGPYGESAVAYCGRYDARSGWRTNYSSRSRSKNSHDQPTKGGGGSMPCEQIFRSQESVLSFTSSRDPQREGGILRIDAASGALGVKSDANQEHDTPLSSNDPQDTIRAGSRRSQKEEEEEDEEEEEGGMHANREQVGSLLPHPQSIIPQALPTPLRMPPDAEVSPFINLIYTATVKAGLLSPSLMRNELSEARRSLEADLLPYFTPQVGDLEEKSSWERQRAAGLLPLSSVEPRNSSTGSLGKPSVGPADTGASAADSFHPAPSPTVHIDPFAGARVEGGRSSRGEQGAGAARGDEVPSFFCEILSNPAGHGVKDGDVCIQKVTPKMAGSVVAEDEESERKGEFVDDAIDRVRVPLSGYTKEEGSIQKRLVFSEPIVNGGAVDSETDATSGLPELHLAIKYSEYLDASKGSSPKESGGDLLLFSQRSVMRCFIVSCTHPPGHLLCRVMHVLQQQSPDGEAARLAMETDILHFLQEPCGDFDPKMTKRSEETSSPLLMSDVGAHKGGKKDTKRQTEEQVHCIVRDLVEQGIIRLEITSCKRRMAVLQKLDKVLSAPTLAEQEAYFVELMKYLRARSPLLPPYDMVALIASLAAFSSEPACALMDLYDASPVAAVHQNHRPLDRRRLFELLQGRRASLPSSGEYSGGGRMTEGGMLVRKERQGVSICEPSGAAGVDGDGYYSLEDVAAPHHHIVHPDDASGRRERGNDSRSKSQSAGIATESDVVRHHRDVSFESLQTTNSGSRRVEESISAGSPLAVSALRLEGGRGLVSPCGFPRGSGGGASSTRKSEREGNTPTDRESPANPSGGGAPLAHGDLLLHSSLPRSGECDLVGCAKQEPALSEVPQTQSPPMGESTPTLDGAGAGEVSKEPEDSSVYPSRQTQGDYSRVVGHEKAYVVSCGHTEGSAVCRAWRVLHADGMGHGQLTAQARTALIEDFFAFLQPPEGDTLHTVSSVDIIFDEGSGTTERLRLKVKTNERRAVIAARLQASVLRGDLAGANGGDAFSLTPPTSHVVAHQIAQLNQTYFPRLQSFLEDNPFCDTLVLLQRLFEAPSLRETKRRLLQSYNGLVPLIHYHHGTLLVVLKGFGIKSIDEIEEELNNLRALKSTGRKNSSVVSPPYSVASGPSRESAKQEMDLHSAIEKLNTTSSDTTSVSTDFKEQEAMAPDRTFSAKPLRDSLLQDVVGNHGDGEDKKGPSGVGEDGGVFLGALDASESWHPAESPRRPSSSPSVFPVSSPPSFWEWLRGPGRALAASKPESADPDEGREGGGGGQNAWEALLEGKRRRLMRVAYGGMAQGLIPLDPARRQRVRLLRGRYHHQRVLLTIEWEIFLMLYFERVRSFGSTKRALMLVHPLLCGFASTLVEDEAAAAAADLSYPGDPKRTKPGLLPGKRLMIRIIRPYTPDEVGISQEMLMRQLKTNMQQLMGNGKKKKSLPSVGDLEARSNMGEVEGKEALDQLVNHFQLSLLLEIDSESRRDAVAAFKTLSDSVRRATEALHKSMLAANLPGSPMICNSNANASLQKPLARMPSAP